MATKYTAASVGAQVIPFRVDTNYRSTWEPSFGRETGNRRNQAGYASQYKD
jgi:hypothetical protein